MASGNNSLDPDPVGGQNRLDKFTTQLRGNFGKEVLHNQHLPVTTIQTVSIQFSEASIVRLTVQHILPLTSLLAQQVTWIKQNECPMPGSPPAGILPPKPRVLIDLLKPNSDLGRMSTGLRLGDRKTGVSRLVAALLIFFGRSHHLPGICLETQP